MRIHRSRRLAALLLAAVLGATAQPAVAAEPITIRTENFPRPPQSGATYYVYERDGRPICTKLEVCDKFRNCTSDYRRGTFRDPEDVETGTPFATTPPVVIAPAKLRLHVCLTRFGLI